jgi:hypothetical protein
MEILIIIKTIGYPPPPPPPDIGGLANFFVIFWVSCPLQLLNYLGFEYFDLERTWWVLSERLVVRTRFDIYVFITTFFTWQSKFRPTGSITVSFFYLPYLFIDWLVFNANASSI